MKRRALLAGVGGSTSTILAGCTLPSETQSSSSPTDGVSYNMSGFAPSLPIDSDHATVLHFQSGAEFDQLAQSFDSTYPDLHAFIEETDFSESLVMYVGTRAPNACHELELQSLEMETDALVTGKIASVDTSGADEDCAQVVVVPSRVVRITPEEGGPPTHAELAVQNGWGDVKTMESTSVQTFRSRSAPRESFPP